MGTPEFAVAPLEALLNEGYDIVAVITVPDKPAGRGKNLQASPVKIFAVEHKLTVLQPEKLRDDEFISDLRAIDADLQIVVAFRMLPEVIWSMPPLGTFNLHASLLPQYRGAAPINHAIINGEKKTGLTTFFINKEIDTGKIIFREEMPIGDEETAGDLHDRMMIKGAELVLQTVRAIETGNIKTKPQEAISGEEIQLKPAPKIFTENTNIHWDQDARNIFNLVRGLSPYPAARAIIETWDKSQVPLKIYFLSFSTESLNLSPGTISSDGKTYLKVAAGTGHVSITDLQQPGKKRMDIKNFLMGFKNITECRFIVDGAIE